FSLQARTLTFIRICSIQDGLGQMMGPRSGVVMRPKLRINLRDDFPSQRQRSLQLFRKTVCRQRPAI
ncbi:MAG: hypothetical protein ABLQ96_00650, partial [Candidatus Acidiferrum sp.]